MITVICGDDIVNSRDYISQLKNKFKENNYEIYNIEGKNIEEIYKWRLESVSLFSTKKVFFVENLAKFLRNKKNIILSQRIDDIAKDKKIELYDWEDLSSREIKAIKNSNIKEFKPDTSIFKLIDAFVPGNKKTFIALLNSVINHTEEGLIFALFTKHIRNLILVKEKINIPKLQTWQIRKLDMQAKLWEHKKLISVYETLFRIDLKLKTSNNPYSIKNSLDIVACHYL